MKRLIFGLAILFVGAALAVEEDTTTLAPEAEEGPVFVQKVNETEGQERKKKAFSFLQVMKFPNDVCAGSSRNGTCYSSDECSSKGGTSSGTCANGFGVCCIFSLSCGQSSSENNTYLILGATTSPSPTVCTYTLCETNANICKIRLDFTTFTIAGPSTVATIAAQVATNSQLNGAIGDCVTDSFVVSAPGNRGTPVICGQNTGQHIYLDTSASGCAKAVFDFGSSTTSRQYEIKVTQYNCGDENAGPNDCLQYFNTDTGVVKSFNFFTTNGAVTSAVTHLSSQNYAMCFRRSAGKCGICFSPTVIAAALAVGTQHSFGVSVSNNAAAKAGTDTDCNADYLTIPNANSAAIAVLAATKNNVNRLCGRFFNWDTTAANQAASATVCSSTRPYRILFNSNDFETLGGADATAAEEFAPTAGTIGFSLDFFMLSC